MIAINVVLHRPDKHPSYFDIRTQVVPNRGDILHVDGFPVLLVQEVQHRVIRGSSESGSHVITLVVKEL